ncbi:MAG: hypothetical protein LPK19_13670 [Hymenobacteraceae bacterium]|nr:hypothetical protein [Hymenobacteraceae bacterium]MDX5397274.1 hypothetical protein [Hymenobacteraceae bacterium]MDX5513352.1 hypothetical protein [Hymenobacteraceae bacterium]
MSLILKLLLGLHIAAGFTALAAGTAAWLTVKGSRKHSLSGRVFFFSMMAVVVTAFVVAVFRFNPFLLLIAAFSFYMTYTGYRSLILRRMHQPAPAQADWIAVATGAAFLIAMATVLILRKPDNVSAVLIPGVFSVIFAGMLFTDAKSYLQKQPWQRQQLMLRHISRMGGAFIATVTAFVVVNVHVEPAFIPWLLPTVVFTPLIAYHSRKIKLQLT